MSGSQRDIGTPNGIVVCVDYAAEDRITGRFYHNYSVEAVQFSTTEQLIFKMEALFDRLNYPQPTTSIRSFGRVPTVHIDSADRADRQTQMRKTEKEWEKKMENRELLSKHGDLGSFVVRVQHRQNSSWQGRLTWIEENKTVSFRSIWEMIKLIENAVNIANGPEDSIGGLSLEEI